MNLMPAKRSTILKTFHSAFECTMEENGFQSEPLAGQIRQRFTSTKRMAQKHLYSPEGDVYVLGKLVIGNQRHQYSLNLRLEGTFHKPGEYPQKLPPTQIRLIFDSDRGFHGFVVKKIKQYLIFLEDALEVEGLFVA